MENLKYTLIKNKEQYYSYCTLLEELLDKTPGSSVLNDEIDLLTLLIEHYDEEHNSFKDVDPIRLLHSFMKDHKLNATAIANLLNVSKGYVSDILNYKKGLSKEVIRKLSAHFKVKQEAFNRPYPLSPASNLEQVSAGE